MNRGAEPARISDMSAPFDQSKHPRGADGTFANKAYADAGQVELGAPTHTAGMDENTCPSELAHLFADFLFSHDFESALPAQQPKVVADMQALVAMPDREFVEKAELYIADSANAERFNGNHAHVFARTTGAYLESQRRLVNSGHREYCERSLYERAYRRAQASIGYPEDRPMRCTCADFA